jgi:hypothetical protein
MEKGRGGGVEEQDKCGLGGEGIQGKERGGPGQEGGREEREANCTFGSALY